MRRTSRKVKRRPEPKPDYPAAIAAVILTFVIIGVYVGYASLPPKPGGITPEDRAALGRMIRSMELERHEPLPKPTRSRPSVKQPGPDEARRLAHRAALEHGLEPSLLHGLLLAENSGRLTANVSRTGAIGPAQLMPRTAKEMGVDPRDATDNVRGGAKYLRKMIARYGDRTLGLVAYNWGPGNTDRWLKQGGRWSGLPKETRDYVSKVSVNAAVSGRGEREIQLAWEGQ